MIRRYRLVVGGVEIGEPLSWLLALIALIIAVLGPGIVSARGLTSGYSAGIILGFILHEGMHRYFARRAGMNASFVATGYGIVITLLSAALPIKILAPGYVKVWGYRMSPLGAFKSVVAGPASNVALSTLLLLLALSTTGRLRGWLIDAAEINAWLALFNLFPVGPLDGRKIIQFKTSVWLALFVASMVLYGVSLYL